MTDDDFLGFMLDSDETYNAGDTTWVAVRSDIAEYHAYRVKPPMNRQLCLVREPHNEYDENAVAVMHGSSIVGHVPRNLASIMSPLIKDNIILKAVALYTGVIRNDGAYRGGGCKLEAVYMLETGNNSNAMRVEKLVKERGFCGNVFFDSLCHLTFSLSD